MRYSAQNKTKKYMVFFISMKSNCPIAWNTAYYICLSVHPIQVESTADLAIEFVSWFKYIMVTW